MWIRLKKAIVITSRKKCNSDLTLGLLGLWNNPLSESVLKYMAVQKDNDYHFLSTGHRIYEFVLKKTKPNMLFYWSTQLEVMVL